MATKIVRCGPLVVAGVGAVLSGCTGTDMSIAMGPNGPIPPANVGSVSSYAAPPASASALSKSSPLAPSPSGTVAAEPLSSPINESPLAPPSSSVASAAPSSNMRWSVGPQAVGHERQAPPAPAETRVASMPEAEPEYQSAANDPVPANEPAMSEPLSPEPPLQQQAALEPAANSSLRPASMGGEQARPGSARSEIQFLPVVGAPQRDAEMLARVLSEESRRAGITIRPASGPVAPIRLKGYFSAFTDGNETSLVYVWDVLDDKDQRIRRIQGQEKVAGTDADPWSRIDMETLRKVAQDTMREAAGIGAEIG